MSRNFKRAALRREKRLEEANPKHQVKLEDHDGMPLETSADSLTSQISTRTFRKECFRSRERVFVPTAVRRSKADRKVSEMNFCQLGRSFRRSYAKRFQHIPAMFKRITGTDENAEKSRNLLIMATKAHDEHIIRVNTEIGKRHTKHIAAKVRQQTEARLW